MDYAKILIGAAQSILESDGRHASAPPPTLADPTKFRVTATLKPHQIEGVSWLLSRYDLGINVILGDEMGLGKTMQAIVLLSYLKFHSKTPVPFLVLCPLSVTDGWMSEFSKFCPSMNVLRYVGEKGHRCDLRRIMHEHVQKGSKSCDVQLELPFDVVLATYDIAMLDQDFLSQIP